MQESSCIKTMEKEIAYKAHVLVLPFHGQGHVNPMLQFSKRLASKGLKITLATTFSNTKTMQTGTDSISLESIYDDCTEGGVGASGGYKAFIERFEVSGTRNLVEFIKKQDYSVYPVKFLVYDASFTWALDIAKQLGVAAAGFFTQSCAAVANYYSMHLESLGKPWSTPLFLVGLPQLGLPNVSSLGPVSGRYPPIILHILKQFTNIDKADWVLFNSFDKLEEEVVNWMANLWPVRTIGPTVPSIYLDKRMDDDSDYGFNLYTPNTDTSMKWLNSMKTGSVVYVSFGSNATLNAEQMTEMASALRQSSSNFLWVVKPSEENKLPSKFVEETSEKGLVVTWCPQLKVLAHNAVGCFITHCGWNSTVEALSFGVPMVAMPQFLDQMTNAYFVEEVWGVGVKPKVDAKEVATGEEIDRCIKEIIHGKKGREIKKNALHWKELAKKSVDEGGSSDKSIDEIISRLVSK